MLSVCVSTTSVRASVCVTTSVSIRLATTSIVYTVSSTTSVCFDSTISMLYTTKAPLLVVRF